VQAESRKERLAAQAEERVADQAANRPKVCIAKNCDRTTCVKVHLSTRAAY
jgi:hypothetical protein